MNQKVKIITVTEDKVRIPIIRYSTPNLRNYLNYGSDTHKKEMIRVILFKIKHEMGYVSSFKTQNSTREEKIELFYYKKSRNLFRHIFFRVRTRRSQVGSSERLCFEKLLAQGS